MIDFHSHILPKIDDGSRSVEETFALLKEAEEVGFTDIILTPHYIEAYYEMTSEEVKELTLAIAEGCEKKNIKINLHTGNELYFSENIVHLIMDEKASPINGSKYVLFEFPMNNKPMNLYDSIYGLKSSGYIPVLAHPERYSFMQEEPELVYELVKSGVLMQCNYGSIVGKYGKKAQTIFEILLKCDLVHFLGSDVHHENTVYQQMSKALKKIEKIVGKNKLEKLSTVHPKKALDNQDIIIKEPEKIRLSLSERLVLGIK